MEPSLGWWARSPEEGRAKIGAGFRNFVSSPEDFILHFCVRHYLCAPQQRYHLTDLSKGAMLVDRANRARAHRYDRWFDLLLDEIALVAAPQARIIAVGDVVAKHLTRRRFARPFARVMHYSGQAALARKRGIAGREAALSEFAKRISMDDIVVTANSVLRWANVPQELRIEALVRLQRTQLTESRRQLMFIYRQAFEAIRAADGPAV
jgi:hypothetical protein